jgi:PAS domain S-box-containing protein
MIRNVSLKRSLIGCGIAVGVVATAFLLRQLLTGFVGADLPTYLTFYPAVMLVAILAGFGAGLLATGMAALLAAFWILHPQGQFAVTRLSDAVSLAFFSGMGVLISLLVELYRRSRRKSAAYEKELALRESQEDLNRAQAVAHTGSWRLDVRRNELVWSDENHRIFGIPKGTSMTYETFLATVHPEDREYVGQKWTAALRGEPYDIEHRIVTGDGVKWVRERAELEFDPQGVLRGGFGTTQDITERKQAEQAMLRAKQEWERTFDAVPDLIAILDDRHRILRANRAMAQRLGLTPAQCVGMLCHKAVHGLDYPPDFCPHTLTLADGREHVAEVHEDSLGGDFLVSTTPLADEQGRHIASVHVARDLTQHKLREERIARLTKLYAVLSRVNEAIVRVHDEGPLYAEVCRIVAEEGEFPLVWIGQVKERKVAPAASHGPAADYLKEIRVEVEGELGHGPTGNCIREDRPMINDDFDTNPSTAPWREPALRYGFRASAAFPLHRQGKVVGTLTLYAAEPDAFDTEQVNLLEALCADISYALDAIQQEKFRAEAEQRLRDSEARFRLLSETAGRLLVAQNPQAIVNDLCRDVMTHLDCQVFFNFLADEEADRLHLNACAGIPAEETRKIEWLDYGVGVSGCVARDGVRIIAEEIANPPDPRTELVKSYGIQAYACHPLMVQGRVIGTLSFGTKTRPNFTPGELALMRTVTDQVAAAMERMTLIRELQRSRDELETRVQERTAELGRINEALRHLSSRILSAQEDERKRIAGELHDTIGACLSAIKFKVENVLPQIGKTPKAATESLKTILPVIQEGVEDCRRIQMDLRPPMLDDLGLQATLSWFCRRFQMIYSEIQVDQEIKMEEDGVPSPLKIVAYRITQEAMNNIAKHSKADRVRLSIRKVNRRMELTIQDNGQGFNPKKALALESTRGGLGFSSMRERVNLSGGSLDIESAEGKGTIIRASWPL